MIRIDLESPQPIEQQIAAALRQALARGEVDPGEELPSVRQLAADLGVHWNTVARAYRRLADEGLLLVRRGRSVLVRGGEPRTRTRATHAELRRLFAETIAAGVLSGLTHEGLSRIFEEALAGFSGRE
ncbi:MAG: GntR family transcriptional regulator [Longimicrobiales bacterium]